MQLHSYLKEIRNQYSSTYFEAKSQEILLRKLILFYTSWLFFYLLFILTSSLIILLLIATSLGFINFLLAINLGHDALHRKVFKYSLFQFLSEHTFTICGIDIVYWKISHNIHHANPNTIGVDTDIETRTIPFLKLYRNKLGNYLIRYQHLYFPLLYLFTSLWWFSLKDFSAIIVEIRENKSSLFKLSGYLLRKIFHLSIFLFIPAFCGKGIIMSLILFIIIHFVQGFSMALLFQVTHVNNRVAVIAIHNGNKSDFESIEHQLITTSNFNTSLLITYFLGGLNYQIEHHLFPGIPHTLYPEISKKIKHYLIENNLTYIEFNSYIQALKAHYFQLKLIGDRG